MLVHRFLHESSTPIQLDIMASPTRTSDQTATTNTTTTLSEYLHNQFETIISHNKAPKQKIEVIHRINDFINNRNETTKQRSQDDLFSPLISDVHLTIKSGINNMSTGNEMQMNSGIQLPVIEWHSQFRKGYSMLMWVRFHTLDDDDSSSSSPDHLQPQLLYRFATSSSPAAHGIQATLHRDTSQTSNADSIPCILRVETLRPPSPSSTKSDSNMSMHSNSLTTPVTIPKSKWTLIGIQHSFPYLKRPTLSITVNGAEVDKGEVSYPTLGGELGEVMRDNYILCNLPIGSSRSSSSSASASASASGYKSSRLGLEMVDFAGFGLFKETIPTLIQGIICEHGPCYAADGVIPAVPPVVQNHDGVVMGGERQAMHKKGGATSGPFGLTSNSNRTNVSVGRGIGIPLCTGVMLSSDGNYQGEVLMQKLLSKLVIGLNASKAVTMGGDRVTIPVTTGCSIGLTGDVLKIGIVQPKEPYVDPAVAAAAKKGRKKNSVDPNEENLNVAKCMGQINIFNATHEFLKSERSLEPLGSVAIPSYSLPSYMVVGPRPIPSFLNSFSSVDTIGYILGAFHLSLPPPGYPHNLQTKFYHDSFDHLHDLVVYRGGALAAQLIELFTTNLSLGGRMREEILHTGSLHVLVTLLRRVLLRAIRLGMFSNKIVRSGQEQLWQVYAPREKPGDELLDMHALKQSAPSHVPELISKACCLIIGACCGPSEKEGSRCKRPPLSLHIRRASDLALTAIFGFAFDMDIWGGDPTAFAAVMEEIVKRYCSDCFNVNGGTEITRKFDSGYGRVLRFEMSVQYLLDIIRIRFGDEIILSKNHGAKVQEAQKSIAMSLSRLLYMMLKYSLSSNKTIFQGEHDVASAVSALSDCQLGSIGSHAVLVAMRDLLVYCEAFPSSGVISTVVGGNETDAEAVSTILHDNGLKRHNEKDTKLLIMLKRIKSDIAGRLARNLILAQFHDVIAPLLLSRTIFDGRRGVSDFDSSRDLDAIHNSDDDAKQMESSKFYWQHDWRLVLHLFTVSSTYRCVCQSLLSSCRFAIRI